MHRVAALVLLVPLLLALPGGTATGSGCGYPLGQDDAGSGRDAGAGAATAVAISESRYDGILGAPLSAGVVDLEDVYAVTLAGDQETVMAEVYLQRWEPPLPPYTPQPVQLEAWAPGAATPTHVGQVTFEGTVNATFVNDLAGVWHLRVAFVPGDEELPAAAPDPGCGAGSVAPPGLYSFYFGCNPVCIDEE